MILSPVQSRIQTQLQAFIHTPKKYNLRDLLRVLRVIWELLRNDLWSENLKLNSAVKLYALDYRISIYTQNREKIYLRVFLFDTNNIAEQFHCISQKNRFWTEIAQVGVDFC